METSGSLTVRVTTNGFLLLGEIDSSTADLLAEHLQSRNTTAGDLTVDMQGIQFIDSTGLRVLVEAHQVAENRGDRLLIERPSAVVSRLLDVSGLAEYLHVVDFVD